MPISAPTVGLSFGSFGDIVTVLQLAWELRAALDESAGASAELRALVGDIDGFTRALQDVQANFERRRRSLRPDVVNGIAAALSRCRGILSAIQQRIERARGQTSSSGWQKYWGTTAWCILGGKKDVEALRGRLSEQLGMMQLYLSLSEANCQEYVHDVVVANNTTLQRIYSVVQEIQLRFDVGVPSFQFYDRFNNLYYPPLARTSLQRLRDVCEVMLRPGDKTMMSLGDHGPKTITEKYLNDLSVKSTQGTILLNLGHFSAPSYGSVEGYFFREAAFGEWQVLVEPLCAGQYSDRILKALLERNHTIGTDCNCPVACATRYRDDLGDLVWRNEASKVYSEVLSLVFAHLEPVELEPGWLGSLLDALQEWPDPTRLQLTAPTILARKPWSPGDIVDLISKTPTGRTQAEPMSYRYNSHFVRFYGEGAALSRLLVGDVQPNSDGNLFHEVRAPDWGYIRDCGMDESGYSVLSLAMNLNNECPCCNSNKHDRGELEADITEAPEM